MTSRKILSLALAFALLVTVLSACTASPSPSPSAAIGAGKAAGLITDVGGVKDQSFNQSAWEGLQRAQTEFGVDAKYLESKTEADYKSNIETMVDQGKDLIWGIGFMMGDSIKQAGIDYKDQKFAIIDYAYDAADVPNKNITGVVFKAEECSFLVGYIAGKMTTTNKVGHINGIPSPTMESFAVGFYAGVKAANPDCEVIGQYSGFFDSPETGKSIANQYYADGCDIIYSAAGSTGNGAIEAAKEKGLWAIGVDKDQNYLAPANVLTSALKRVDVAVYDVTKKMCEGTFVGGDTLVYSLANEGVGYSKTGNHIPKEITDAVDQIIKDIIAGTQKVPATKAEIEAMYPGFYNMGGE